MSQLIEEDKTYSNVFEPFVFTPEGRRLLHVAQSSSRDQDLWTFDLDTKQMQRVSTINPAFENRVFGVTRLVEFRSHDNQPLQATLLLPAGYEPSKRYPMVVWVYASNSVAAAASLNRFGMIGTSSYNLQVLSTRGYAVLWPDIPTKKGTPVQDLMKAVMPAIDRVIDMGIADPDRLAVTGQSNGGYSTLALITQSRRFKAAVMNAGFGDLTAFHGVWTGAWIPRVLAAAWACHPGKHRCVTSRTLPSTTSIASKRRC